MDIYEFALEFEKRHGDFYREQAEKAGNRGLKRVFNRLAEEEAKHEKVVKKLAAGEKVEHVESDLIPDVKEAFDRIAVDVEEETAPTGQVDLYKKALEMEEESYDFYQSKAEETDLPHVRRVFKALAREEKKHENIVGNILEFVNRPSTWLEDAEWYHLEDY